MCVCVCVCMHSQTCGIACDTNEGSVCEYVCVQVTVCGCMGVSMSMFVDIL